MAVFLCSGAVKLLDDCLDQSPDSIAGRRNWAAVLGPGAPVYAALLLAVAAGIRAEVCLPLFFASYGVGMFNDLGRRLPSGLSGWQESLLVAATGGWLFGWRMMLFAFLFIAAVQLADDCVDMHTDRLCGQRNLACRFGCVEALLAAAVAFAAAWGLNEALFPPVFAGAAVFYLGLLRCQGVKL